jgi:hypothetical protein
MNLSKQAGELTHSVSCLVLDKLHLLRDRGRLLPGGLSSRVERTCPPLSELLASAKLRGQGTYENRDAEEENSSGSRRLELWPSLVNGTEEQNTY